MAVERRSVWSSHLNEMSYDADAQTLHVTFANGRTAAYDGVPPEKWQASFAEPSIGTWFAREIKGQHQHRYTDDEAV